MSDEPPILGQRQPTTHERPSDDSLLASLRHDRPEALGMLYDRYAGLVMAVAVRIVRDRSAAETVMEQVFYDLWKNAIKTAGGPLLNHLISHARTLAVRHRRFTPPPPVDVPADVQMAGPGENQLPDQALASDDDGTAEDSNLRWQRERSKVALASVPSDARQVVEMLVLDAWDADEIAHRLKRTRQAVLRLLVEGMRDFSKAMRKSPAAAKAFDNAHFPPVSLDRVRVLVVDDEPDARRILSHTLRTVGASVTVAASAAEALRLLPKSKPQVLVSDLAMPNEDGFDLIRTLRRDGQTARDLPAIALTAFASADIQRRALLAGFQTHVAKPVDPRDLALVIASLTGHTGTLTLLA